MLVCACGETANDDGGPDGGATADAEVGQPDAALGTDATTASPDAGANNVVLSETFGSDGNAWPQPWVISGGVHTADVVGGRGRLAPTLSGYSLARMHIPGNETNVDARIEIEFDELGSQGLGFYARQNGGYLGQTSPTGEGYAVFVEGFRGGPFIGVWREVNGHEIEITKTNTQPSLTNDAIYVVRFRVEQDGNATRLRAKIWPRTGSEPSAWAVDTTDSAAGLQNLSGGFAIDAWSSRTSGGAPAADLFVDNLTIERL